VPSFLFNIKHLNVRNKKMFKFKYSFKVLKLANILLENRLISNYSIIKNELLVSLKNYPGRNYPLINTVKNFSNSKKSVNISFTDLYYLTLKNPTSLFVLDSTIGIIDHRKALAIKSGGNLLFKIN
jgi:ribosomal protein S8